MLQQALDEDLDLLLGGAGLRRGALGALGSRRSLGALSCFFSCLGALGASGFGASGLGASALGVSAFTGAGVSGLGGSGFFTGAAALGLEREAELRATLGASGTGSGAS